MADRLAEAIDDIGLQDFIRKADEAALGREVATEPSEATRQPLPGRLARLGYLYELQGVEAYRRGTAEPAALEVARNNFHQAFRCWRAVASVEHYGGAGQDRTSPAGLRIVAEEISGEPVPADLALAFRIGVAALVSERAAEGRLELARFDLPAKGESSDWRDRVASHVLVAFALLVRKRGGWADIDQAVEQINELRHLQETVEAEYLDSQVSEVAQTVKALQLVGLYHMAQQVTLAGTYVQVGTAAGARQQVNARLDRHRDRAVAAFAAAHSPLLTHLATLLWVGTRELVQNSIWSHIDGMTEDVRRFARLLADRGRPQPVLELWRSQQEALRRHLLDPYQRAAIVQMRTSAGKTLLAKFTIVQTRSANPDGVVAYVVPTRALVNQVTTDLRRDFSPLGWRVEQAIPAFELDPMEEKLLASRPDVLVTTPEKLDLLVRRDHPSTRDLALVVADEAHNLGDGERGARFEVVLATLKRDRPGARFLLLSPFLPNSAELVRWLGEDRALDPIIVDWKPGRTLVGVVKNEGERREKRLAFETLPSVGNTDVRAGLRVPLGPPAARNTVKSLTYASTRQLLRRGQVLVLCHGPGTAEERARELVDLLPRRAPSEDVEIVARYLDAELGSASPLGRLLRRGAAVHHAGLSPEAKWLVEGLIAGGAVRIVCGTTTLAQGVNFPISSVVVETSRKGRSGTLSYDEFWNLAGRAGRTLMDPVGIVAFPAESPEKQRHWTAFLERDAQEITSQLLKVLTQADEIARDFNAAVRATPELSPLLQFLSHALRVSNRANLADEIEDLLRASLVYHQASRLGQDAVARLVRLARAYLATIEPRAGAVSLADSTGFATPSVLTLLRSAQRNPALANMAQWMPSRLFGSDTALLTARIVEISDLPEIRLGQHEHGPFSPERVAEILIGWVRGDSLGLLASRYSTAGEEDPGDRVGSFSRYLFRMIGLASWGLGALETVCAAGQTDIPPEVAYVPAMVYFGVASPEAVWLRMVGVPRIAAGGMANIWKSQQQPEPASFEQLRAWVNTLSSDEWARLAPRDSALSGSDLRTLWSRIAANTEPVAGAMG